MTTSNASTTLHLLGGPRMVSRGRPIGLPEGSKRLVAYVALHGRRVERRCLAQALWPEVDQHRAAGNLRSAMWRLRGCRVRVLQADPTTVRLHRDVRVDVDDVCSWAERVVAGRAGRRDLEVAPTLLDALDLLPGWYDDWVDDQRERLRRTLLQAIDALASVLVRQNRCADAVDAALAAVSIEPLRESAQRALIEAHIAEGNRCEAWRTFAAYDRMLVRELGIHPSGELRRLLRFERDDAQRDATIGVRSGSGSNTLWPSAARSVTS
jgi:DNA-binding SARP family transcriptional activator